MKTILLCAALAFVVGCDSTTTVEEKAMTVTPLSLTFQAGESSKTISITHNCSCPFTWNGTPVDSTGTLMAFSGTMDNTAKDISIMRANLQSDTLNAYWVVTSNGYGTDTIHVTVIR